MFVRCSPGDDDRLILDPSGLLLLLLLCLCSIILFLKGGMYLSVDAFKDPPLLPDPPSLDISPCFRFFGLDAGSVKSKSIDLIL